MLLAIDIGNTNVKSVLFSSDQLIDFTIHQNSIDVIEYLNKKNFHNVALCSVNPASQKIITDKISNLGKSVFQASIQHKLNLTINYETPSSLGMDRLCSAVGALDFATNEKLISDNQYLFTIDFGTATTINIVSPGLQFIGGLIAPGIMTMLNSLNEKTAQLPFPNQDSFGGLVGNSTDSSIMSGVLNSTIGMINETVNYLVTESEVYPLIFATGGNAKFILPFLKHKIILDETLVLKGLKVIYDLNN